MVDYRVIGDIRKRLSIRQKDLCLDSGLSQSLMSKYENGSVKTPSFSHLKAIAGGLGLTVDQLDDACANWDKFNEIVRPKTDKVSYHYVIDRLEGIMDAYDPNHHDKTDLKYVYSKLKEFKHECIYNLGVQQRNEHKEKTR